MKLLFTAVFVFSSLTVALAQQCDSRGITGLMQCYNNMLKTLDVPFSRNITEIFSNPKMQNMDQPKYCKTYSEKTKCLGDYEKSCVNAPSFSKAFGINARESMEFLMMEYFSQYMCKENKDFSKSQCKFDSASLVNGCTYLQSRTFGCEFVTSALKCFDDGMAQQCKEKEVVEYFSKGLRYVFQKVVPQCDL